MKNYEKPEVEYVELVANEEIAGPLSRMVEGDTGLTSSIF